MAISASSRSGSVVRSQASYNSTACRIMPFMLSSFCCGDIRRRISNSGRQSLSMSECYGEPPGEQRSSCTHVLFLAEKASFGETEGTSDQMTKLLEDCEDSSVSASRGALYGEGSERVSDS